MRRILTNRLIAALATFVIGVIAVSVWVYYRESQRIEVQPSSGRWESIFFRSIDRTTQLAQIEELRKTVVKNGDVEVRFWHGFGLSPLEAVILKRTDGRWSGFHIKTNNYTEPENAFVEDLLPPRSGWDSLWKNVTDKGLLNLPDCSGEDCYGEIDGTSYVVEINQYHIYRTYKYPSTDFPSACSVEEIDIFIGMEFDNGREKCTEAQWFPCAELRRSYTSKSASPGK